MELYTYFRSSAAYRVRIALNLKGLAYEGSFVHLTRSGGEQHAAEYRAVNPQGLVPTLIDDGNVLTQSLAIIEYLDETHPAPPLLPREAAARARVRALAQLIACDIHPLNTNALRFKCPLAPYPTLQRIFKTCMTLEAFRAAAPENQPDAEP